MKTICRMLKRRSRIIAVICCLVKDIVIRDIRGGVLPYDAAHDDFTVEGLEERIGQDFAFESAGESLRVVFGGLADRIDRLPDGTLRVVDYKTGEPHLDFQGVEALFRGEAKQCLIHILQMLLYSMMLFHSRGRRCRADALLRAGHAPGRLFVPARRSGVGAHGRTLFRIPRAFRTAVARNPRRDVRSGDSVPSMRGCRAYLPLLRFPRDLQTLTRACRSDFLRVVFSERRLHFQSAPCPTIAFRGWCPRS